MMKNAMRYVTVHGLMKSVQMESLSLGCVLDQLTDSAAFSKVGYSIVFIRKRSPKYFLCM